MSGGTSGAGYLAAASATAFIYATGVHPYNQQPVCVARTPKEKQEQRSFFFWYIPEMKSALRASLNRLGLKSVAAPSPEPKKPHPFQRFFKNKSTR